MSSDISMALEVPLYSIRDVLLEIKDTISQALSNIQIPQVGNGDSGSSGMMKGFEKDMGKTMKSMGAMIKGTLTSALGPIAILGAILMAFSEPLALITEPLQAIGDIFSVILYPILQPLSDKIWELADYFSDLMVKLEPYMPLIEAISAALLNLLIENFLKRIEFIYNQIMLWFNFIKSIIDSIVALFKGEISFSEFLAQIWAAIVKLIGDLIANFYTYVSGIWDNIMGFIGDFGIEIVDWFKNLPSLIMDGIKNGWDALGNWWDGLWD